ncbi:MAG: GyrI-like domain-containing protein [Flavobacteriales bacterium]
MIEPQIVQVPEKRLVGAHLSMSFTNFRIAELWQSFIPKKHLITMAAGTDMISMAIYKPDHFAQFNPANEFEKWAAIEVTSFENIPDGLSSFTVPAGLYAVFHYTGLNTDNSIYQYIFSSWLPTSGYELDQRPHFEVLGEKYKNNDPNSEEDIYIPVRAAN